MSGGDAYSGGTYIPVTPERLRASIDEEEERALRGPRVRAYEGFEEECHSPDCKRANFKPRHLKDQK